MSKKIRPKNLLSDKTIDVSAINKPTTENSILVDCLDEMSIIENNIHFTAADREKLEKYDGLVATITQLNNEKSQLEDKLAEYASKKLDDKANFAKIEKLKKTIAELKTQIKEKEDKNSSSDLEKLKSQIIALRKEADDYLVKISELTFENAKLTCELNECKEQPKSIAAINIKTPTLARPTMHGYVNNGYESW